MQEMKEITDLEDSSGPD